MSFFSGTRETSARFGTHIAEFQDLCKRHEVSAGTPEDFFRLAPKLAYDEKFRADFCQLTKSVAQREEGHLTLTRILTIIAIAIGGEGIDAMGTAGAVPVSLVVVFLAGVGGWSEDEKKVEGTLVESLPSSNPPSLMEDSTVLKEEQEALELERRLAAEPNNLGEMTASLFGGPALVKEALCRLELNTLELKLHLDSIDSRMERIEPHLDDLTSRLTKDGPREMEVPRRIEASYGKNPLPAVRFSQPELRIATAVPEMKVVPVVVPAAQADKLQMRRLHQLVTALALLLLAMTGVLGTLLYLRNGDKAKTEVERILAATIGDASAKTSSASPPIRNVEEPVRSLPSATPVSETQHSEADLPAATSKALPPKELEETSAVVPSSPAESTRKINLPRNREEEAPNSPTIHLADALPGAVAIKTESGLGLAVVRGESMPPGIPDRSVPAIGDMTAVQAVNGRTKIFVPASALIRNAIASPPPSYPSIARIQRVEGDVVLQVLVDEKGKIETMSIVNGPEPLRNAALDALRNWRFRPYVIDGHPVAVRTLVDFHFKITP